MKKILLSLTAIIAVLSLQAQLIIPAKDFAAELKTNKTMVVIDVQAADVYAKQHIQGAINIPHKSLYKTGAIEGQFLSTEELAAIFGKKGVSNTSKIVLYDEPTAGLDPITKRAIVELMIKLRDTEGVTGVFVTHDLNAAATIATEHALADKDGNLTFQTAGEAADLLNTNFIMLQNGAICFEGTYNDLMHSDMPYVRAFVS